MPLYCHLYIIHSSTCLSRYFAHGTATDFMYDIVGVPMAFTFEVCLLNFFLFFLLDFSVSLRLLVLTSRYMVMEQPHQEIVSKCSIPPTLLPTMYVALTQQGSLHSIRVFPIPLLSRVFFFF